MKACVEVVGISLESIGLHEKKKEIQKKKRIQILTPSKSALLQAGKQDAQSKAIINQLSTQVNQLKEIIGRMCYVLVQNEQERTKVWNK